MIYLDHAATSFPKPIEVQHAMQMATSCGNPGRSGHGPGLDASRYIFEARNKCAEFLNCKDEERIIFTSGATEALNLAILGSLKPSFKIVTTDLEHNSVARVLEASEEQMSLNWLCLSAKNGDFHLNLMDEINKSDIPNIVIVNHISNVTGVRQNLSELRRVCLDNNILLIIDGSQSIGHEVVELHKNEILCFGGHKGLMGPMGVGVMALGEEVQLKPLKFGGTGSNSESLEMPSTLPDRLEVGTQNVPGIHSLGVAIDLFDRDKLVNIESHLQELRALLINSLKDLKEVVVHSPLKGGSAISIDIPGYDIGNLSHNLWDKYQICTRVGLQCSPLAHKSLGTFPNGTLRISLGADTKKVIIKAFVDSLKKELKY